MTHRFPAFPATLGLGAGLILACGGAPDLDSPKTLTTQRISFDYPGNWTIESEQSRNEGLLMGLHEVEGTDSAMVFVTAYDAQAPFAAHDVAEMYIDALPGQLMGMEMEVTGRGTTTATVAGQSREGAEVRFTARLFDVDVPHTVQVFTLQSQQRTASVIVQVADEDRAMEQPGIDLVLQTLELR